MKGHPTSQLVQPILVIHKNIGERMDTDTKN